MQFLNRARSPRLVQSFYRDTLRLFSKCSLLDAPQNLTQNTYCTSLKDVSIITLSSRNYCSKASKIVDFRCSQCGQRFKKELELKKHTLRKHGKVTAPSEQSTPSTLEKAPTTTFTVETPKVSKVPKDSLSEDSTKATAILDVNQAIFECDICVRNFRSVKDLQDHESSAQHKNACTELFRDDDLISLANQEGPKSPLMAEVIELHKQCKLVEEEIQKLTTPPKEDEPVHLRKIESEPSSASPHIPHTYPFKYTVKTNENKDNACEKEQAVKTEKKSLLACQDKCDALPPIFVNEAHLLGSVNIELQCCYRGTEPSAKFSVLVRRPVMASVLQKAENANSDSSRIMEEESFIVECRGEKWCTLAKQSIRPGVILSVHGRLSMRPQFHEVDGSYTYNAVIEVSPIEGNIQILQSNAELC